MPDLPSPTTMPAHLPDDALRYQVHDGIAEITLGHRPANALTLALIDRLIDALERASRDNAVRAVIVHSSVPRFFCAGLDLKLLQGAEPAAIHALIERLYPALNDAQHQLGKPSIAAVAGAARGGGMTLAIGCDLIVAGRSASFGYPEIDIGVLPAIHFTHLPRVVGRHRAFDLLFTGRPFGADEAERLGLVSRVVADEAVLAEARVLARTLAAKPAGALRLGRAAFKQATDHGYRQGVFNAVDTFCSSALAPDGREGVAAFAEKRPPSWRR